MNAAVTPARNDRMLLPKVLFGFVGLVMLVLCGVCLATFLAGLGFFEPPDVTPISFEPEAWRRADPIERSRTVRSQMIDDLIRSAVLTGLTRFEVEKLLGPPMANAAPQHDGHFVYYLGMERQGAWSLDNEYLVIGFDQSGQVVKYWTQVD